ncbi:hypothetical protein DKX38_027680 [Salix brachista]|uniref:Uncharacterized protein n=1 Tax=Salix brachista TaxID=2182728 RepID=A0A5N5J7R4_9ROSI|nr:hypothetical protein DKX38_027680 [Salix brachista]
MYATRPLSTYKRNPSALSSPPPEGSNSGILIIQDEEDDLTCCFCLQNIDYVKDLPFPQNKNLTVTTRRTGNGKNLDNKVNFIPVLNQPLSSNRYYLIECQGKHKGEAHTNSKKEDVKTCCFGFCIPDPGKEPEPFNPKNVYQQFEIRKGDRRDSYAAESVAPEGTPPSFLRREGWEVSASTTTDLELKEAAGLDRNLRARLPDFNLPLSQRSSAPAVVGSWCCPFMFIKEGKLKDQMSVSRYYGMKLEQRWEQIFAREYNSSDGHSVAVNAVVQRETAAVAGREAAPDRRNTADGVMWFSSSGDVGGGTSVGLSLEIVEGMKWERERGGWLGGDETEVTVERVEEFGGIGGWKKFGCYVLVERFVLTRMDGSLVLTYDFKHTHHIRSKWE